MIHPLSSVSRPVLDGFFFSLSPARRGPAVPGRRGAMPTASCIRFKHGRCFAGQTATGNTAEGSCWFFDPACHHHATCSTCTLGDKRFPSRIEVTIRQRRKNDAPSPRRSMGAAYEADLVCSRSMAPALPSRPVAPQS